MKSGAKRSVVPILLTLALACFVSAPATASEPVQPENRYLFIVDTSFSMNRVARAAHDSLAELLGAGLFGEMRDGDTFGLWTFNSELQAGQYPMQVWTRATSSALARDAVEFIRKRVREKEGDFAKVTPFIQPVIEGSESIRIIILTDGRTAIQGTPFDNDINAVFDYYQRELREARIPFVVILAAGRGQMTSYTVNSSVGVRVPQLPAVERPRPAPAQSVVQAPQPPPAPVVEKETQRQAAKPSPPLQVAAKPAPPPDPPPALQPAPKPEETTPTVLPAPRPGTEKAEPPAATGIIAPPVTLQVESPPAATKPLAEAKPVEAPGKEPTPPPRKTDIARVEAQPPTAAPAPLLTPPPPAVEKPVPPAQSKEVPVTKSAPPVEQPTPPPPVAPIEKPVKPKIEPMIVAETFPPAPETKSEPAVIQSDETERAQEDQPAVIAIGPNPPERYLIAALVLLAVSLIAALVLLRSARRRAQPSLISRSMAGGRSSKTRPGREIAQ